MPELRFKLKSHLKQSQQSVRTRGSTPFNYGSASYAAASRYQERGQYVRSLTFALKTLQALTSAKAFRMSNPGYGGTSRDIIQLKCKPSLACFSQDVARRVHTVIWTTTSSYLMIAAKLSWLS